MYSTCSDYLEVWTIPLQYLSCFMWTVLSDTPKWNDVEPCVKYLTDIGVRIDDAKHFDQLKNLKLFTERFSGDEDFNKLLAHQKWTKYFEGSKNIELHSELLKIAQFIFAIPSHNANAERIFSLMQSRWTMERNPLSVESSKGILLLQYNFRQTSCKEFHAFLKNNQPLLKQIQSTSKYAWANQQEED